MTAGDSDDTNCPACLQSKTANALKEWTFDVILFLFGINQSQ